MMMPAAMVLVSICLLIRVFGSAPSLLPRRAGNRDDFTCVSALGSTQSIRRTKGKGKKERNCFLRIIHILFLPGTFFCCRICSDGPSRVCSCSSRRAAAFVYLFSDAFVRGFASLVSLTLGVAFGIRSGVAASLFQAEGCSSYLVCISLCSCACLPVLRCLCSWLRSGGFLDFRRGLRHLGWCSSISVLLQKGTAAALVYLCLGAFARGFALFVFLILGVIYHILAACVAAFSVGCKHKGAAATMCAAFVAAAFWGVPRPGR